MQFQMMLSLILLFSVLIVFLFVCHKVSAWAKQRRQEEMSNLRYYHKRVSVLVSEMLAKANELDQHRLYVLANPDTQFSHKLATACQDLVVLSESLPMIEHLLDGGQIRIGRRDLLATLHSANRINQHLDGMQMQLKALTDAQMPAGESLSIKKQKKKPSDS
jgi:hypothetical protein